MAERETEFKYLLSEQDSQALRRCLGEPLKSREFVNRYYAVRGGSDRRDWVLRLRVEGDNKTLTLKIGREVAPGVFDSQEYSARGVSESPGSWEEYEPLKVLRREISSGALYLQGEMENRREVFLAPCDVGRNWELDLALLPGGVELRELEIEVQGESEGLEELRGRLEAWFFEQGLSPSLSETTKYARFLGCLKQGEVSST